MRYNIQSKLLVLCGFLLMVVFLPATTHAVISVQGVNGTWSGVTGGTYVEGTGTNQIYWGGESQSTDQKSSYLFEPASPSIFSVTLDQPFTIGKFTHINNVIPVGAGITGAQLNLLMSLNIDGTLLNNIPFTFNFQHNETPNVSGKCPPGSASVCDDIVTFTNNDPSANIFTVNGQQYTLTLSGFLVNGKQAQQFLTQEDKANKAYLEGVISLNHINVPEPSTYLLLGSTLGITLLGLRQRKRYTVQ